MPQYFTYSISPSSRLHAESYTFSAKEKDSETGLSYFGSRYYSSDLSIWLSVDPMAAKYASLSPYVYCANNPVKLVDPNGEEINPIYDRLGYFLGTDDRGLQRDFIVMERTNFQQNMSHDDALKNSTYFDMKNWWNPINWGRNLETIIGKRVAGEGEPYTIFLYGTAKLKRANYAD